VLSHSTKKGYENSDNITQPNSDKNPNETDDKSDDSIQIIETPSQTTELASVTIHSPETTNTNNPSKTKDLNVRPYSPPRVAKTSDPKTATQTGPVYGRGEEGGKYFFFIKSISFIFNLKLKRIFTFSNTKKTKKKEQYIHDIKEYANIEVLSVNLSDVAALLFQDKTTVLAQPEVNHRQLSLSFIKDKDFQVRMQQKGNDFSEEMHALIYEIIDEEEYNQTLHDSCVSIHSTYKIHDHESIGHIIADKKAIYPTIKGLQTFVDIFELGNTNKEHIIVANNDSQPIMKIMVKFFEQDKSIFASYKKTPFGKHIYTDNSSKKVQANFNKLITKIRQTPIRFGYVRRSASLWFDSAFIGKLHYSKLNATKI
jgi:hypothetical protein